MSKLKIITVVLWALAIAAVAAYFVARSTAGQANDAQSPNQPIAVDDGSLPRLFDTPDFEFTNHADKTLNSDALKDKVWVGFLFLTHCPTGACPVMVGKMAELQKALPDGEIEFVSFSVDPERDTPEAMGEYVKTVTGDTPGDRWHLLTGGTQASMQEFATTMKMAVGEDFGHSTQFLLIDKDGYARGVYGNTDPDAMTRLRAEAKQLLAAGGR